ncbi:hypothetical protein ACFL5O_08865 [Myxococcota bacterium]
MGHVHDEFGIGESGIGREGRQREVRSGWESSALSRESQLRRGGVPGWCTAALAACVVWGCSNWAEPTGEPAVQVATHRSRLELASSYQVQVGFPAGFDQSTVALYATESLRVTDGVVVQNDSAVLAPVVSVGAGKVELEVIRKASRATQA